MGKTNINYLEIITSIGFIIIFIVSCVQIAKINYFNGRLSACNEMGMIYSENKICESCEDYGMIYLNGKCETEKQNYDFNKLLNVK